MEKKTFEEEVAEEIRASKNNWNYKNYTSYKLNNIDIRQIFATKHEVNLEKDANGFPIPGTGREITDEEKKLVFDYILEKNYPLTKKMYRIVLNAYINDEIELNQQIKL